MKKQKNYDKKVRQTRILLSDYLILKSIAQKAGVSMSQALHRLIEHQAQLPLMDRLVRPMSAITTQSVPVFRTALVTTIATNGSKGAAFRIQPGRVRND